MSNSQTQPGVNTNAGAAGAGSIEPAISQYLSQHFLVDFRSDATADTDLFENGFIDSYGYIELIAFLEKTFKIRFTDEELISRALRTLNSIVAMVEKKVNGN